MTRPLLHLTPPHGYLGDPNGIVEYGGRLHVFHQWTPEVIRFGRMCWGHAVSRDAVTWEHRGVALAPSDRYDEDGCWSGSAVAGGTGRPRFLYTAAADVQRPRLATAVDDRLDVLAAGEVLVDPPAGVVDFRDPYSWEFDGRRRVTLVTLEPGGAPALPTYQEEPGGWRLVDTLGRAELPGVPGRVWECVAVLLLADRWVALVSVVEGEVGDERYSVWAATFAEVPCRGARPRWVGRLDLGDCYYAALPWRRADGAWWLLAWVRMHADPAAAREAWIGCLTMPRELTLVGDRVLPTLPPAWTEGLVRHPWTPDDVAVELEVETGPDGVVRLGALDVPVGRLVSGHGEVRVLFDAGVVEAFGPAGCWTGTDRASVRLDGHQAFGSAVVRGIAGIAPGSRPPSSRA